MFFPSSNSGMILSVSVRLDPSGKVLVWLSLAKTIAASQTIPTMIVTGFMVCFRRLVLGRGNHRDGSGFGKLPVLGKTLAPSIIKLFGFVKDIIPPELVPTTGDMRRNDVLVC
jgi:hypothetical protein